MQIRHTFASTVRILDGSMGNVLLDRLGEPQAGLWSAKCLVQYPEEVVKIHKEYIEAGADIIETNSYSTIPLYLSKENMEDRAVELAQLAG